MFSALFALSMFGAATATAIQPAAVNAATCDRVNIVYCGLEGSTLNGYMSSFKQKYTSGTDNGHNDLKQVFRWAGATDAKVRDMDNTNTKMGTLYRNGDIIVNGQRVAHDSWVSARFTEGQGFVQIKEGVWARKTTTSFANAQVPVIVHFDANNEVDFAVMVDCGNAVKTTPVPQPKPTVECLSLNASKVAGNPRKYNFIARGAATRTTIESYTFNFGDGERDTVRTTDTTARTSHEYGQDGKEFTATVEVKAKDISGAVTSRNCKVTVVTAKVEEKKDLACVSLSHRFVSGKERTVVLTARAEASNTTITRYVFNVSGSDAFSKSQTVRTSEETATSDELLLDADGKSYTATVTVSSQDVADVTSGACKITFTTLNAEECKPGIPVGDERCKEQPRVEECKPGVPVGSAECEEEQPQTLPVTGPGSILGAVAGMSTAGGILHYVIRRKLLDL